MEQGRRRIWSTEGVAALAVGLLLTACGGEADAASSAIPPDPSGTEATESDEVADSDDVVEAAQSVIEDVDDIPSEAAASGGGSLTIDGESYDQALSITCGVLGITVQGLGPETVPYMLALLPEDISDAALLFNPIGFTSEPGGAELLIYPFAQAQEAIGLASSFLLDGAAPATTPGEGVPFEATGTLDDVGEFRVRGNC